MRESVVSLVPGASDSREGQNYIVQIIEYKLCCSNTVSSSPFINTYREGPVALKSSHYILFAFTCGTIARSRRKLLLKALQFRFHSSQVPMLKRCIAGTLAQLNFDCMLEANSLFCFFENYTVLYCDNGDTHATPRRPPAKN